MGPVNRRRFFAVTATAVVVAAAVVGVAASRSPDCETYPDARDADLTHQLCGPILQHYRTTGGPDGVHGLPDSDERPASPRSRGYGDRGVGFANGTITVDTRSGETSSAFWERGD